MHDRPIIISFECDHWLYYDYVNGSPLSRACGQCFNGSPLMPDGQKKNMSPIRYLIGQSLYLGSLSHLLSSLSRFSLVDQESECERDWNSYAQPIHTCLLNPLYSDSAATRVVYSFLNPASSRSLNMGMPERKKGYPRYSSLPSKARIKGGTPDSNRCDIEVDSIVQSLLLCYYFVEYSKQDEKARGKNLT